MFSQGILSISERVQIDRFDSGVQGHRLAMPNLGELPDAREFLLSFFLPLPLLLCATKSD